MLAGVFAVPAFTEDIEMLTHFFADGAGTVYPIMGAFFTAAGADAVNPAVGTGIYAPFTAIGISIPTIIVAAAYIVTIQIAPGQFQRFRFVPFILSVTAKLESGSIFRKHYLEYAIPQRSGINSRTLIFDITRGPIPCNDIDLPYIAEGAEVPVIQLMLGAGIPASLALTVFENLMGAGLSAGITIAGNRGIGFMGTFAAAAGAVIGLIPGSMGTMLLADGTDTGIPDVGTGMFEDYDVVLTLYIFIGNPDGVVGTVTDKGLCFVA